MSKFHGRLLFIDDDQDALVFWKKTLELKGFIVDTGSKLKDLDDMMSQYTYDAIMLDIELENETGLDGIPKIISSKPHTKIFILTAHASVDSAVSAMRQGADGYIEKSSSPDKIAETIVDALPTDNFDESLGMESADFRSIGLVGESDAYLKFCENIAQLRDVDSTVLILGESGTGKEVVARALHHFSSRSKETFAAINCAAIPENLLESELFGHKKGAFTDAKTSRVGIFEMCSKGTLLLDEIGDMPLSLQTKLLRVLQERKITPVGGSLSVDINTRVIAATHRDLLEEIHDGRFREDLYYRLSVVPIVIPPLRHRKKDIPLLVEHFIEMLNKKFNKSIKMPGPDFMQRLTAYDWPGNIRELKNSIERAVVLSRNDSLSVDNLFQHLNLATKAQPETNDNSWIPEYIHDMQLTEAKQVFEKEYITEKLKEYKGNVTDASKKAGRYRADVYRLIEKYGIDHRNLN